MDEEATSIQILNEYLGKGVILYVGTNVGDILLEGKLDKNTNGYYVHGENGTWHCTPGKPLKLKITDAQTLYLERMHD